MSRHNYLLLCFYTYARKLNPLALMSMYIIHVKGLSFPFTQLKDYLYNKVEKLIKKNGFVMRVQQQLSTT